MNSNSATLFPMNLKKPSCFQCTQRRTTGPYLTPPQDALTNFKDKIYLPGARGAANRRWRRLRKVVSARGLAGWGACGRARLHALAAQGPQCARLSAWPC